MQDRSRRADEVLRLDRWDSRWLDFSSKPPRPVKPVYSDRAPAIVRLVNVATHGELVQEVVGRGGEVDTALLPFGRLARAPASTSEAMECLDNITAALGDMEREGRVRPAPDGARLQALADRVAEHSSRCIAPPHPPLPILLLFLLLFLHADLILLVGVCVRHLNQPHHFSTPGVLL